MDTLRIIQASFGDAAAFLCDGLLFFFINKFVIARFGSGLLPVVGVATAIWGFLEFFNGIGVAIQPIVTVYYGENNTKSIRTVMCSAMRVAVVEGLTLTVLLGLFAEPVVRLIGLSDPALVAASCTAIRCMCGGFVALAFAGLFNSYYMFIERAAMAGAVTFLCYLIMPIGCTLAFAAGGANGVWVGIGFGPFAGLLATAAIIIAKDGLSMCPLLLPRNREDKLHVFNLSLTDHEIVTTSCQVAAALKTAGHDDSMIMRASLMLEEVLMAVKDRNPGRDILAEATLDLNDGVSLTLRDDGVIFDITDADQQISSLRSFLVASMMQFHDGRMNLVTTGFNRNVFKF